MGIGFILVSCLLWRVHAQYTQTRHCGVTALNLYLNWWRKALLSSVAYWSAPRKNHRGTVNRYPLLTPQHGTQRTIWCEASKQIAANCYYQVLERYWRRATSRKNKWNFFSIGDRLRKILFSIPAAVCFIFPCQTLLYLRRQEHAE